MSFLRTIFIASIFLLVAACQPLDFSTVAKKQFSEVGRNLSLIPATGKQDKREIPLLKNMVNSASADVLMNAGFKSAVRSAVMSGPAVKSAEGELLAQRSAVQVSQSLKDFQVSGTMYSGVEDVTDETVGIALVLSANRMVYDGGQLDSQISAQEHLANAASYNLLSVKNERALAAVEAWLELERYRALNELIGERLKVLGPLILQLERVAEAGVGDVSQVVAAQRTVTLIRVTQTDVAERLEQARVNFRNIYGHLPKRSEYDAAYISSAVPKDVTDALVLQSSALQAEYAAYLAAVAGLRSVEAKDNYNIGFESKLQRPVGGSEFDSDESIGLVVQKTLYNGNKLSAEISQAEAKVEAQAAKLKSTFRRGQRAVETSRQTIKSMDRAIAIAVENAENSSEEIDYLRKQLIIGQSTLDSVLSAEARLYDAQSKEINFLSDRKKAEITLLATFGLFVELFNLQ